MYSDNNLLWKDIVKLSTDQETKWADARSQAGPSPADLVENPTEIDLSAVAAIQIEAGEFCADLELKGTPTEIEVQRNTAPFSSAPGAGESPWLGGFVTRG